MGSAIKLPETINELFDNQVLHCEKIGINTDHPQREEAKNLISKMSYLKSIDNKSLEYKDGVNSIIDELIKHNREIYEVGDTHPENIHGSGNPVESANFINQSNKDGRDWINAIEKLKIK